MSVEVELFLASPSDIERVFSGWSWPAPLLPDFVTRTVRNPFTGQQLTIRSRVPEPEVVADVDATEQPELEELELVDQKGLSTSNLAQLASAVLGWDRDNASSEIHGRMFGGPPDAGVLLQLPPALTARLASLTSGELEDCGRRWATLFREDASSIEADSIREHELSRLDSEWIARLEQLSRLAQRARATTQDIFVWIAA